ATREDAAIAGAALEDAAPAPGVAGFYEVRHAGFGEVELALRALVVVVEARDVRLHPIHGRGLEGGRGGGEADRHCTSDEAAAGEGRGGVGDGAGPKRRLEDFAGEAVDLHHEEAPPCRRLRRPEPRPAGEPVREALEREGKVVEHLCRLRPAVPVHRRGVRHGGEESIASAGPAYI